jgi:outer membrane protein TolC
LGRQNPLGLFSGPKAVWQYGAQLAAPLFHGGSLWFKRRSAMDSYDQSFATYRQAVLAGLAQVANALRALEHDAQQVEAQARQEAEAHESSAGARSRVWCGGRHPGTQRRRWFGRKAG